MALNLRISLHAAAALLIAACAFASPPVAAKPDNTPQAITTLDVCEDLATGSWKYSGVVSLLDARLLDGAGVRIDYLVQNKVNDPGYTDKYRAVAAGGTSSAGGRLSSFSIDAPALTLGTLRGMAKVQVTDPESGSVSKLEAVAVNTAAICGCQIRGCVRTQGYWGNKPGVVWPVGYSRDNMWRASGLTYQQVLDAPVRGSAYLILSKQYITAILNYYSGASAPASIGEVLKEASAWLASGTTIQSCGPGECARQKALAAILDTYNNGDYPGAPGHCDD